MTTIRRPGGIILILLAVVLGVSFLTGTKNVANRGTSSGFSVENSRRQDPLVEPALRKAIEVFEANREKVPTELALPSESQTPDEAKVHVASIEPSPSVSASALIAGMTAQEEIDLLATLYATKYGVDATTLREIARCESTDNPSATSSSGARGLGQFLRSTWESTPLERFGWDSVYHPAVNLEAAAWMLSQGRVGEFHAIPCH